MQILIGGLLLDGSAASDPAYTIELDGVSGIFGGPGVRSVSAARPMAHGVYDLPDFRDARLIRVRGLVLSQGLYEQQKRMEALGSLLGDGGRTVLSVTAALGSRWCTVGLSDSPDLEVVVPGRVARYQLLLRAPDPRLYGETQSFTGGTVSAYHYGNFPASPVVTVAGPRSAPYTITGPGGRVVTVTQALTAGQSHRIDFRTGRVYRGGALQVGALGKAEFWTIPAGKQTAMSISSGSMTVAVDDTYM